SYIQVLAALFDAGVQWVQIAEPATVADLAVANDAEIAAHLKAAYSKILAAENRPQVYVTTPYGSARAGLEVLAKLAPEALHVDLSVGTQALDSDYVNRVKNTVDTAKTQLVTGLVDGRNVWAGNLRALREVFEQFDGAPVSTSVSLQHVPHTVEAEPNLPVDVAAWFSFANERTGEVVALAQGRPYAAGAPARPDRAVRTRAGSTRTHNRQVADRTAAVPDGEVQPEPAFAERQEAH